MFGCRPPWEGGWYAQSGFEPSPPLQGITVCMDIDKVVAGLQELKLPASNTEPIDHAITVIRMLEHEYITTRGLWCIDRNPAEVDPDWIKRNAFKLSFDL